MIKYVDPQKVPQKTLYTGAKMPCIGMGTFGSDRYTSEEVSTAVAGAIKAGYRLFDCAAVYGNEDVIGKVFKEAMDEDIVKREDLFVTTKVWNDMHEKVEESCKKSIKDLQIEYVDLFFIHWPFPNYHAPKCDGDSRNPDSKPFSVEEFMNTWRQCEALVEKGIVRHIGMSNMTIPKLDAVLPFCKIKPAAIEMECHPTFQQQELFDYMVARDIVPIGFSPIGSPKRPLRDTTPEDVEDIFLPKLVAIAERHKVHPAVLCLKWAVQRGQVPIPFAVLEEKYVANIACTLEGPLTEEEMKVFEGFEKNNRLIKGQVFLWETAKSWEELWDLKGIIG